jgi:hypothetical protein
MTEAGGITSSLPILTNIPSNIHFISPTEIVMEADPNGKNPHEPGAKLDAGKPCAFRGGIAYFPRAFTEIARVSTFGASKYAWKGWETVPDGIARYSDAMVRHLLREGEGEVLDPDSGLTHAAHVAWGALARLELMMRELEKKNATES